MGLCDNDSGSSGPVAPASGRHIALSAEYASLAAQASAASFGLFLRPANHEASRAVFLVRPVFLVVGPVVVYAVTNRLRLNPVEEVFWVDARDEHADDNSTIQQPYATFSLTGRRSGCRMGRRRRNL